jgi:hypothetical protein
MKSIGNGEKMKTKKLENKTEPFIKVKAVRRPHSQQSTHHHQRKCVVFLSSLEINGEPIATAHLCTHVFCYSIRGN